VARYSIFSPCQDKSNEHDTKSKMSASGIKMFAKINFFIESIIDEMIQIFGNCITTCLDLRWLLAKGRLA
jgi:hypothetical protein